MFTSVSCSLVGHRIPTAQQGAWGVASHLEPGSHCAGRRAFHIRTNAPGPGVVQVDAKLLSLAQWPGDFLGRHFILSLEWNCTHCLQSKPEPRPLHTPAHSLL